MKKFLKAISLFFAIVFILTMCVSCRDSSKNDNENLSSTNKKLTLEERKEMAEYAVAEYINDYMRRSANTGKYSVIDYSKMRYKASSAAAGYGDVFTVNIDIYHYDSFGEYVGKNSNKIKASAKVDIYGNVSNVEALSFIPIDWD